MTNKEAIAIIRKEYLCVDRDCDIERSCGKCDLMMPTKEPILEAYNMAIKALETIPKYKDAYNKGWDDGAKATYEHLKMCEEEQDGDLISRDELLKAIDTWDKFGCDADTKLVPYQDHYIPYIHYDDVIKCIKGMPSVNPQEPKADTWSIKDVADSLEKHGLIRNQEPKTGHCKDCKYFEYDSVVKVDGIPLIVAHEICSRWGNGCKTREDGYCFLFEPKESEGEE